jgi:hypothetical protein
MYNGDINQSLLVWGKRYLNYYFIRIAVYGPAHDLNYSSMTKRDLQRRRI